MITLNGLKDIEWIELYGEEGGRRWDTNGNEVPLFGRIQILPPVTTSKLQMKLGARTVYIELNARKSGPKLILRAMGPRGDGCTWGALGVIGIFGDCGPQNIQSRSDWSVIGKDVLVYGTVEVKGIDNDEETWKKPMETFQKVVRRQIEFSNRLQVIEPLKGVQSAPYAVRVEGAMWGGAEPYGLLPGSYFRTRGTCVDGWGYYEWLLKDWLSMKGYSVKDWTEGVKNRDKHMYTVLSFIGTALGAVKYIPDSRTVNGREKGMDVYNMDTLPNDCEDCAWKALRVFEDLRGREPNNDWQKCLITCLLRTGRPVAISGRAYTPDGKWDQQGSGGVHMYLLLMPDHIMDKVFNTEFGEVVDAPNECMYVEGIVGVTPYEWGQRSAEIDHVIEDAKKAYGSMLACRTEWQHDYWMDGNIEAARWALRAMSPHLRQDMVLCEVGSNKGGVSLSDLRQGNARSFNWGEISEKELEKEEELVNNWLIPFKLDTLEGPWQDNRKRPVENKPEYTRKQHVKGEIHLRHWRWVQGAEPLGYGWMVRWAVQEQQTGSLGMHLLW